MQKVVHMENINEVKRFVIEASKCKSDITITSGVYKVDAKSILGVLSLDLSKDVKVESTGEDSQRFFENIDDLILKN